ncbi:hypothetical protein clem_02635 [Legionella clemsonensis]|uniref:Uncharacterized protein n=1 Tax=Legionella clemsonensis TaxID=1867846 RepID=A0A222NZS7_9GAMM|nr:hypothetical protein clem_02635 [Legionella clemsonensis]
MLIYGHSKIATVLINSEKLLLAITKEIIIFLLATQDYHRLASHSYQRLASSLYFCRSQSREIPDES